MSHISVHPMPKDCPKENEPNVFNWCDIPLFAWKGWDTIDTDTLVFYDCYLYSEYLNNIIAQYYIGHPSIPKETREVYATVRLDGWIIIEVTGERDRDDEYVIFEGYIPDIPDVAMKLQERWDKIDKTV